MADGVVESRITKAVVQGEARVGKTSTKCLLVAEEYTNKTSTSCIESPCVAVKCYGHKGKWERYNDERLEITVISEIRSRAEEKSTESHPRPKINLTRFVKSIIKSIKKHKGSKQQEDAPAQLPGGGAQPVTTSGTTDSATQEEAVRTVQQFLEKCNASINEETRLHEQRWLYFIDSGGQTQFQKLLPAFMPYASVLLLVVSVSKNLSDQASTIMQLPEEEVNDGVNSLSVAETLKQLLSAIASSAQHYRSLIAEDPILSQCIRPPSDKLQILPIATHYDEYDEALKSGKESINDKERELNNILACHKSTCEVIRQDERFHLYEVDGRKAQDPVAAKLDPNLQLISQAIEDNAYEVKVPLKWYCFGVLLHDVAKEGCGVLSLSYCQVLGRQLGLSPDQSLSAIKFQSLLNKLLYFPNSSVYDLVFVNLESLVNIIRDLVVFIYKARSDLGILSDEAKALALEGKLSVNVLKRNSDSYKAILQSFPHFEKKLFGLFKDLLIAAQLPDGRFLMPALLPIRSVSTIEPFPNTVPLLLYFEKAVPIGLFCAVIVHLVCRKDYPWEVVDTEHNFSNYFKLQCDEFLVGSVVLVERLDCIALYCESSDDYVIARNALEEAVDDAMSKHNLSKSDKPSRAFHCPCQKGTQHVAVANLFLGGRQYYRIKCTRSEYRLRVDADDVYSPWLSQESKRNLLCDIMIFVSTGKDNEDPDVIKVKPTHHSG